MIRKITHIYLFLLFVGFIVGCNSTKYVPKGDYLLQKVKVKISKSTVTKDDLKPYIRQNPNSQIFGLFNFHLGLYNLSGKNEAHWWNRWFKTIGEPPVLFNEKLVDLSSKQLTQALINKGFFQAVVTDTVYTFPKKKKVKVKYIVEPGPQYRVFDVKYKIDDDSIRKLVMQDTINTLLKPNVPFDVSTHDAERERITNNLRKKGYYAFSKEYIWFLSDSLYGNYQIGDSIMLKRELVKSSTGLDSAVLHSRYKVGNVTYNLNYQPVFSVNRDTLKVDSMRYNGNLIIYKQEPFIKPSVLLMSSQIEVGSLYNYVHVQRTQNMLSSLRALNMVNISFRESGKIDTSGFKLLDCNISLSRAKEQFFSLGLEGTNTSGNFGVATKFNYQHRNLFRGAELFNFSVRFAGQRQLTRENQPFNTIEFGTEAGIELPKFLIPIKIENFRRKYNPKTAFDVSYNSQKRPDYERTIANIQLSYIWRSSRFAKQTVTPISFSYVKIPHVDPRFWAQIENTFLKYSYQDHLVLDASYSYTFSQQRPGQRENFWYYRVQLEEAGNLLNQLNFLTTSSSDGASRELFNVRYAQYAKIDLDLDYTAFFGRINSVAYRLFAGTAYPYGNMDYLPFEKQYFSGGANGIRAWPVRGIGPGGSKSTSNVYNQMGSLKLESNFEYRFKLFWKLEGAVFVDAGNVWLTKDRPEFPDGTFHLDTFYEQIAIGTGAGMRVDFSYFLLRFDLGIQARDPSREAGDRWTLGRHPLTAKQMAFNFAIGYPF